jgi:hypothetical protein
MKIGFTGTGGTGKTTLTEQLKDTWSELGLEKLPFEMRAILAGAHFNITSEYDLLNLSQDELYILQHSAINHRFIVEDTWSVNSWFSDRTALDHFAYIINWVGPTRMNNDLYTHLSNAVCASLQQYDGIFYCPKSIFHQPDGIRLDRELYHHMVDKTIHGFLQDWNVPHITLECKPEHRKSVVRLQLKSIYYKQKTTK